MKNLFKFEHKIISDFDIICALERAGLRAGDDVCVHSELIKIGTPLVARDELLRALTQCFLDVVGERGTLIMPTFTYSFCKNLDYDKKNSKSTTGILSEYFRHLHGSLRTNDPIFSFAAIGSGAKDYANETKSCFGDGCAYDVLLQKGGKIVHFGNESQGFTFSHFAEEKIGVKYRYFKEFSGNIIYENGVNSCKSIDYYVRNLNASSTLDVAKNITIQNNSNNFHKVNLGGGNVALMRCDMYFEAVNSALLRDELALIK